MPADLEAGLADRGWAVIDLPDPQPVLWARDRLVARLREALPGLMDLGSYHAMVEDDRHLATLFDVATDYWESGAGPAIVAANLDFFRRLLGPDLHVQRRPYLRCVRPGRPEDAAPLHRDTYYGASAYEVSAVVPFADMTEEDAIRAIPGSHVEPDAAYPYRQLPADQTLIGSPRHRLGYPYAPRLLDPSLAARAEPVSVRLGQAMIFGLSLVHGGGVNRGTGTRFSTDIRVVNTLAPVQHSRGVDAQYFVPLCSSPVGRSAARYQAANQTGKPDRSG